MGKAQKSENEHAAVIGAAGHVGLGMTLVLADAGYSVTGIDLDTEKNKMIMSGTPPFYEEHSETYLKKALDRGRLSMTNDVAAVRGASVIFIVIGTPLDANMNPHLEDLKSTAREIAKYIQSGTLIVLRSTVSPGTTNKFKQIIENESGYVAGKDIHLTFAPERVAQGKAITEMKQLPQLVGAFDDEGFERARDVFSRFVQNEILPLTPTEAEIGKLMTNAYRYVNFALANEFHLIADMHGANANKIIDASNYDYPRLNVPSPGPNVGGPCLYKDGWFLVEKTPFPEIIRAAFLINEGMTMQILQRLKQYEGINKVGVLGMTFKANSDDARNSLSYKLRRQLDLHGYHVTEYDPHVPDYNTPEKLSGCEAVVLMTPHKEFKDLKNVMGCIGNEKCLYVDIWGFWDEARHASDNGYFYGSEAIV